MLVLKCPYCGNENVEINKELTVGKCEYCDSTFLIPKEFDKKGNLYNRAVFLRQNKEFDKAISAYEDILKGDNTDAEAHWGMVLSKYGIEYVHDKKTETYIPTFHRTDVESILADPDYQAALEYSDLQARRVLEQEGRRLNEIQKGILEISRKETPYDIFICYKESDNEGNRTEDSVLAQEIYYELEKRDYKVFFSRKTLEHRLGEEFEPIIYSALSSAKVMVIVGTTPENFNAVWVRNEWSRFLKMSRTTQKYMIPAYRGMSPYGLPIELSTLQALDMSKLGFMQDLLDGIERFLKSGNGENSKEKTKLEQDIPQAAISGILPAEKLIKNGDTYISLEDYKAAQKSYQQATEYYPEEYLGWWGMIKCATNNLQTALGSLEQVNRYWENIRRLAPEEEFEKIGTQFSKYLDKYAQKDYEKLSDDLKKKYSQKEEECQEWEKNIEKKKKEIEKLFEYKEKNTGRMYERIRWSEQKRIENEKELNAYRNRIRKAFFLGILIILCAIIVGIFLGIALGEIGGVIAFAMIVLVITRVSVKIYQVYLNRDFLENENLRFEDYIPGYKNNILQFEKEYEEAEQKKKNEICEYEKQMTVAQDDCMKIKELLDMDQNNIFPYFQNKWYKLYQVSLVPLPDEDVLKKYKELLKNSNHPN